MRVRLLLLVFSLLFATAPAGAGSAPRILVLGDSISAAYGIDLQAGWVQLLRQRLADRGYPYEVVNGSVSGDTTAGGLSRLPAALRRHQPAIVLIELGGNDGLRALSLDELRRNLGALVELSRQAGATPVLFEMQIPPNYGPRYTQGFVQTFHAVAEREGVPLVPFFLAGIAMDPDKFQADGIHPTAEAQPSLLDAVWPTLEPLLDRAANASASRAGP